MPRKVFVALAAVALGLCGCSKPNWEDTSADQAGGRGAYAGVGIYGPSRQWTRLIANQQAKDPAAARAIDDQVIIVVENSTTGEVRACGDLTGYCIGMNPWKAPLLASQITPVKLTQHVAPDTPDITVQLSEQPKKKTKPHRDPKKSTSNPDDSGGSANK